MCHVQLILAIQGLGNLCWGLNDLHRFNLDKNHKIVRAFMGAALLSLTSYDFLNFAGGKPRLLDSVAFFKPS